MQLLHAIQKKISLGEPVEWLSFFIRVTAATAACGLTAWIGQHYFLSAQAKPSLLGATVLFADIGVAGAVYFLATVALRVPESMELVGFVQRKFGRPLAR